MLAEALHLPKDSLIFINKKKKKHKEVHEKGISNKRVKLIFNINVFMFSFLFFLHDVSLNARSTKELQLYIGTV